MRFGLALPQYDYSLPGSGPITWPDLSGWALRAESLGFDSIWLSDHLFYDLGRYGGQAGYQAGVECFTGLAGLAAVTSRVRLGSLVVCNDLRNPALLAKMASTVDVLSGGRLELGIGAGWFLPEYRAAGIPFDPPGVRISRLAEALQILRRLLDGEEVSFSGRHYRLEGARCLPRPLQERLPLLVGGAGDRVTGLAGRLADGFNSAWAWDVDDFGERVQMVDQAARAAGRNPSEIAKTVGLYVLGGRTEADVARRWDRYVACSPAGRRFPPHGLWGADKLAGTYERIVHKVLAFERVGVTQIMLTFGSIPFQVCDPDAVDEFMAEVAPLVV
ncbi:MAG TPA: LLM class flavin-dependent oxidoreductase [Actinomycetota bacterium]|nr:LLM class flavin-dependent oxidoreductase [Actinomycetota bacterium]